MDKGPLAQEIDTFHQNEDHLKLFHLGRHAVVKGAFVTGIFNDLQAAAQFAMDRYGADHAAGKPLCLIRQVGTINRPRLTYYPAAFS